MKERKTEIRFFTIMQWEEEQAYLQRRHRQGWALERVSAQCVYHFTRCEPQDVVYQLDYHREALRHKEDYVQMFADCGWEYIQDSMGYCYFRKPKADMRVDEEGIFCDDASRLDLILRVFRGRMVPLLIVFTLVILPQLYLHRHLETTLDVTITALYGGMLALYLWVFISFGRKLWQYKASLNL